LPPTIPEDVSRAPGAARLRFSGGSCQVIRGEIVKRVGSMSQPVTISRRRVGCARTIGVSFVRFQFRRRESPGADIDEQPAGRV
jgi:hypothetical protein